MFLKSGKVSLDLEQHYKCDKMVTDISKTTVFICPHYYCDYFCQCNSRFDYHTAGTIGIQFPILFQIASSDPLKWASMNLQSDNNTNRFLAKLIVDKEIEL